MILRHSGTTSSLLEVYIARHSFILVVKETEGVRRVRNFLLLCVHYIPLLRMRETFSGGGGGGGGGVGGKLVFGERAG